MSFSDLSFKFYTDTNLTILFSGLYQLEHKTDLSDGAQDKVIYFGSAATTGTRTLQATSNPGVDNITLTPTQTISAWAANTAYVLGNVVQPVTPNTYRYVVTTAGTSHATTEPVWPTTPIGSTITDGTVTWTLVSKKHPTSEIKLALSSGALGAATGGSALSLGNTITSGASNKVAVYIRITNTVATVSDNTGYPEIKLYMNEVQEVDVT